MSSVDGVMVFRLLGSGSRSCRLDELPLPARRAPRPPRAGPGSARRDRARAARPSRRRQGCAAASKASASSSVQMLMPGQANGSAGKRKARVPLVFAAAATLASPRGGRRPWRRCFCRSPSMPPPRWWRCRCRSASASARCSATSSPGVVIGPVLRLIGQDVEDVLHFAEFGVVMMLFLIGLELEPAAALAACAGALFGLGGLQVALHRCVAVAAICLALGHAVERGAGGRHDPRAVLHRHRAADARGEGPARRPRAARPASRCCSSRTSRSIPFLALLPLLAFGWARRRAGAGDLGTLEDVAGWAKALIMLGAAGAVVLGGQFRGRGRCSASSPGAAARDLHRGGAAARHRHRAADEHASACRRRSAPSSPGVVLANSEYRHELEADIEPFKGLLLGLFFIAVGASIDCRCSPARAAAHPRADRSR